jgi:hypothetical protein
MNVTLSLWLSGKGKAICNLAQNKGLFILFGKDVENPNQI